MNIAFEEGIQASIINLAHNERSPNKVPASKSKQLRLDSPTTISACEELGLLIDDLKQKPIEDFKDPNVDENIVQIRYNHYLKRFNQAIKDVTTRKRRIARRIRNQQLEQQQLEQHSPEILRTRTAGSPEIQNYMAGSVSFMRSPNSVGFSPLAMSITPMADTVNKTIGYFRKSHAVPIVKDLGQIIGKEEDQEEESEDPVKKLERTLSQEVDRFNRAKKQKQREAREVYSSQINRKLMMEKVAEREMKKQEREKKLSLERSKKALERKKIEEDKFERIREAERNYKMQLLEGREKMDQKLEEARKKAEEEAEQRRKKLAEREQMNEMKRQQVLGRKEKLDIQELKMTDELKSKISQKIMKAEETHQDSLNIIKTKIKLQLQRGGSVGKIRRTQTQESSEFIQSFVDKTLKREDSLQAFKIKCYKDVKKKEADSLAKEQRFFSNQMNLQEKQEEKNKVMNDKFTKMQESIEAKRESDEKCRKVKQELNRLKLADKLENHIRMDRRIQFEKLKILDKEKKEQERVFWSKCQKEIAQKAKLEVSVQAKIQRDKIDEGINQLVKKVYEANSSQTVTEVQKKILKSILQPEDYEFIEGKEIKKEEERQKELEKQERGDDRSRSPSPSRKNR